MAHTTITITEELHSRLRRLRRPGESFGELIARTLDTPGLALTAGEVLDALEKLPAPRLKETHLESIRRERGRRSRRPGPPP